MTEDQDIQKRVILTFASYGQETLSEDRVLEKIFRCKKDEVSEQFRVLHDGEPF
jgi:hypothetical protein